MEQKNWAELAAEAKKKSRQDRTREDWDAIFFHATDVVRLPAPDRRARNREFNERHEAWRQRCEQTYGKAEVIVAKQRHGPTGIVRLSFDGSITKFDNLPADEERPGGPAF